MHSPFASPPFKGLSWPLVNVLWALVNLAVAWLLTQPVASLDTASWADVGVCFAGFSAMALQCARSIERLRSEAASGEALWMREADRGRRGKPAEALIEGGESVARKQ